MCKHSAYLNRQITLKDHKIITLIETWLKLQCYLMGTNNWTCKDKVLQFAFVFNIF